MKIVVLADTGWSIGRVHYDVEKELPEHTFIFHTQGSFFFEDFVDDVKSADVVFTTLNNYLYISCLYKTPEERKKIAIVCHGISEIKDVMNHHEFVDFSSDFTYSVTSDVLVPFHPMKVYITPNGVNESLYTYSSHSGKVESLGWAGAYYVPYKNGPWAPEIGFQTKLPVSIASTLSFDNLLKWYKTIDILLVTAGSSKECETGPLPPFEAITCGVLVIGTPVGNFRHVPGPKFTNVEEASSIINELKTNPEMVRSLQKEQYTYVMNNYTYKTLSKKWNNMFMDIYNKV